MPTLLKPRGGRVTVTICEDALLLVGYSPSDVRKWSAVQRNSAYDWAIREHLTASDNDIERVPCPPHVWALRATDA